MVLTHDGPTNEGAVKVRFQSVSQEASLKLAALAKDYNPSFLMAEAVTTGRSSDVMLHPLWISIFVDAGIRTAARGASLSSLTVRHHRGAVQGQALTLEATVGNESASCLSAVFKVLDGRRRLIASGEALMKASN